MKLKLTAILLQFLFASLTLDAGGLNEFNAPKRQTFLEPEKAFKATATKEDSVIRADIILGDKIYIYKKDLHFKITSPVEIELNPVLPEAQKHGKDMIYRSITTSIPLSDIDVNGDYNLTIEMTGCSDAGICYAPQKKTFQFKSESGDGVFGKMISLVKSGNTSKIIDALANENIFFVLTLFFIAGLLLALTPCILPMVPILSAIILQQAKKDGKVKRGTSFTISFVYVVSMALTYALIGIVAGLLKFDIAANLNNPWVIIPFAILFVALALSLFGLFEMALPASWQSKITKASDDAQGKGLIGTAIMGSLSALIVGACTAPVISGAILFIMATGKAFLGGVSLFVMGMGAGVPLLLLGAGADKMVPKPGGWMVVISRIFGVFMLVIALYVISRLLPQPVTMFLTSLMMMGVALYMGTFDSGSSRTGIARLITLLGVVIFLYGTVLFVGFIGGSNSMISPLDKFTGTKTAIENVAKLDKKTSSHLGYSIARLEKEVMNAGKPVVVDIGKDGCAACIELENITFVDSKVVEEMKRFKFIQIDITKNTSDDQALLAKYNVFGAPNILFFDSNGKALPAKFLTGYRTPELFLEDLKSIK